MNASTNTAETAADPAGNSSLATPHMLMRARCDAELATIAQRIADEQSVCEIESTCPAYIQGEAKWFDTRWMTDPREHCGQVIDINTEIIGYALQRGLIAQHTVQPYLVRIARR
jgi:hypothetical protein